MSHQHPICRPDVVDFLNARDLCRFESAAQSFKREVRECDAWRTAAKRMYKTCRLVAAGLKRLRRARHGTADD